MRHFSRRCSCIARIRFLESEFNRFSVQQIQFYLSLNKNLFKTKTKTKKHTVNGYGLINKLSAYRRWAHLHTVENSNNNSNKNNSKAHKCMANNVCYTSVPAAVSAAPQCECQREEDQNPLCIHSFEMWVLKSFLTFCVRLVFFIKYKVCYSNGCVKYFQRNVQKMYVERFKLPFINVFYKIWSMVRQCLWGTFLKSCKKLLHRTF